MLQNFKYQCPYFTIFMISLFEGGLFEIFVFVVKYCHSKILVPPKYLKICYCCSNNMKKSPGTFSGQISLRLNASDCKIYSSFLEHFFRAICSREKSPPKITSEVIFKRIKDTKSNTKSNTKSYSEINCLPDPNHEETVPFHISFLVLKSLQE